MTVTELFNEWMYQHHANRVERSTCDRHETAFRTHIQPYCGSRDISQLTRRDIQYCMNRVINTPSYRTGKPLSAGSINSVYTVYSMMFEYAVEFDLLESSPVDRKKPVKKQGVRHPDAFTRDEQRLIVDHILKTGDDEYYGYLLTLGTGLRLGEVLALTWDDVDFENGTLSVSKGVRYATLEDGKRGFEIASPKTAASTRIIPLPAATLEMLAGMKKRSRSRQVISFASGAQMSRETFTHRYKEMLGRIGIRYLNFHCLRHTFATRALENGMDVKTLSEILGHGDPSVTMKYYVHSSLDQKRRCMEMMTLF